MKAELSEALQKEKFATTFNGLDGSAAVKEKIAQFTTAYTDASLIYYQQGLSDKVVKQRTDTTVKLANVVGKNAEEESKLYRIKFASR